MKYIYIFLILGSLILGVLVFLQPTEGLIFYNYLAFGFFSRMKKKTHYLVGFSVKLQHLIFLLALLQTCNQKLYLFCMKTLMKNDLSLVYFTVYIYQSVSTSCICSVHLHCKKNSGNLREQVKFYSYIIVCTFKLLFNLEYVIKG